jgi:GNAT superfamily N-acetyltransferase
MQPRPLDPRHDLPAVAALLGRTRANGGLTHPGGTQWWLRKLGVGDQAVEAFVWEGAAGLAAFALVDVTFVVTERRADGPTLAEQHDFLERHVRSMGRDSLMTHVAEGTPDQATLEGRGYVKTEMELELLADTTLEPSTLPLPEGFRFMSLEEVGDEAFINGHRAAWSDNRPSPYRRELHEAVKAMPQFRPDLVTIAVAPGGTVASYCIGWLDPVSETLEIEPLGTHRDYRRLGLASAVVREVQHRAWINGAKRVLVWNDPSTNPAAYALYTGAGMPPSRTLAGMTKRL